MVGLAAYLILRSSVAVVKPMEALSIEGTVSAICYVRLIRGSDGQRGSEDAHVRGRKKSPTL